MAGGEQSHQVHRLEHHDIRGMAADRVLNWRYCGKNRSIRASNRIHWEFPLTANLRYDQFKTFAWRRPLKINILFLIFGLALTVISKILQFAFKSKAGDILVFPAAIFFVLAVLFSVGKFTDLLDRENGAREAAQIGFWACLAVVSFQAMAMMVAGQGKSYGLLWLIPFVVSVAALIYKWVTTM